jgi:transcriptional regulator with XRE-family HTH domain
MKSRPKNAPGRWPPNRLRELRTARGLSQAALGARVGVVGSTIHRIEESATKLSWPAAERIGGVLGVAPGDLFEPPRHCSPAVHALARRLADLPAPDREACVLLARALATGEKALANRE